MPRKTLEQYHSIFNDRGINSDLYSGPNGQFLPLLPELLGRPLKHDEMDYNLELLDEVLKNYRVLNSTGSSGILGASDLGKYLKFDEVNGTYAWSLSEIDSGIDGTSGTSGVDGIGIPEGGTTGQFLVKLSDNDYDTTWTNLTPALDEEGREITDDLNQIPNNTTGDAAPTGVFISFTPFADSNVQVLVNGISINLADGELEKASQPCYFSGDGGLTARNIADIEAGDGLFWNGSIAKYNLDDTDDVDLLYEASNRDL